MPRSIVLSIDGIATELTTFAADGYDRTLADAGDVEYSLWGSAVVDGILRPHKHVWTIKAYCTRSEHDRVWQIFRRSERKRAAQQAFSIRLHDTIQEYVEDGNTRYRAIAAGATVRSDEFGGGIAYHAQFNVRILQPSGKESGNGKLTHYVSFVLKELDTVAP